METHTQAVASHYDQDDICAGIRAALDASDLDQSALTIDDFAGMDEVHTRGREATVEIAGLTEISADMAVVDVGCGVGGPARYLASTFGCHVQGIDLTPSFIEAATYLADLVGLSDKVSFKNGSALDMPYADQSFDLAWTVQMQMNISDKAALYREILRVLKPGGRFVFQDIVAGPEGEITLPVPWASSRSHSHLMAPAALRETIAGAGFEELVWRDITGAQKAWTKDQAGKPPGKKPPLGIELVLGPDAKTKRINSSRSLMDGAIGFVQGVFARPA